MENNNSMLIDEDVKYDFLFDEKILNGLHITFDEEKVNENIKNFNIDPRTIGEDSDATVTFTKIYHYCILTLNMKGHSGERLAQLVIDDSINLRDLKKSKDEVVLEWRDYLLKGLALLKSSPF